MQYKLIYLQRDLIFFENDDIIMDFVLVDENDDIVSDLSGWTFKGEIEGSADELQLGNSYFSVSGAKITLTIPNTDTELNNVDHNFEIQATYNSRNYTVFRDKLNIKEEVVDF